MNFCFSPGVLETEIYGLMYDELQHLLQARVIKYDIKKIMSLRRSFILKYRLEKKGVMKESKP